MIDQFIKIVQDSMLTVFRLPELVTMFISILPIVEARGAIPIALGYNIPPLLAWLYAFIGSSMIVPLLLLVLLPLINWLGKAKIFKKAAKVIYEKFEQKSAGIISKDQQTSPQNADDTLTQEQQKAAEILCLKKIETKKFWGVLLFVAIPLPLTGVWTGSAVAAILKMKYPKAILAIVLGNLIASGIITLLCALFSNYINYIILAIGIIAILAVLILIIKIILHKPTPTPKQGE